MEARVSNSTVRVAQSIFNHPHIFILTVLMGIIYNTILIAIIYITIIIPIYIYITRLIIRRGPAREESEILCCLQPQPVRCIHLDLFH